MSNVTAVTRFNPSLAGLWAATPSTQHSPHGLFCFPLRCSELLRPAHSSGSPGDHAEDDTPVRRRIYLKNQHFSVQSLPRPPSFPPVTPSTSPSGAPPAAAAASVTTAAAAHNQNPVLSKLLMADQEAPLDLTVKKPKAEPTEQGATSLSKHAHPLTETRRPTHRRPA